MIPKTFSEALELVVGLALCLGILAVWTVGYVGLNPPSYEPVKVHMIRD